ncbi:MAG TPA: hypothetical protein PLW31_09460 [Bacteroidales bacterium]|nr:hypothetical protein [Bacteroidales bacterium]HPI85835.1 hypothetical protein [Bacteroidales bacterium]HPM92334.1 hypothetical protein [Bacteroidales bacterium]
MNPVTDHFQKLEQLIRQLAEDHNRNKSEKEILTRLSVTQQLTIDEQKTEIENLKKQVEALKLAKSVEHHEETGKVKEKIHDLVREIDRCIELLNK